MNWDAPEIRRLVRLALREDRSGRDVTTLALIPGAWRVRAEIRAQQQGVAAGLPLARIFFKALDRRTRFSLLIKDGDRVAPVTVMARIEGNARAVLSAERPALNALQHLSGVATFTAEQVRRLGSAKTKLLDTRKTLPGWRLLEKYAVRAGGGTNHRMSLAGAVLVKDNHVKMCRLMGENWIARLKSFRRRRPSMPVQVEIQTERDLREALDLKPDLVLLDNLPVPALKTMIQRLRDAIPAVQIEISGGVRPEHLSALARLGVERISMGCLTHSAPAFDCSLEITHVHAR